MLLGAERLGGSEPLPWQRPLAVLLGFALLVETAFVFYTRTDLAPELLVPLADFGSPAAIGEVLFNRYLLPFEVTSILLLIAMIGALVLTRDTKS
jgi:NADH-quinone oxidoreductase subunit J